jgi:hypothetical protein
MQSVTEATSNWLSLPLIILVSAVVALSIYFLMRRRRSSVPGKVPVFVWVVFVWIPWAFMTTMFVVTISSTSIETPAAMVIDGDSMRARVPRESFPLDRWEVEIDDSWSKWKAYDNSIEQAGVIPTRPAEKSWVGTPGSTYDSVSRSQIYVGHSAAAIDAATALRQAREAASDGILRSLANHYWTTAYEQHRGQLPLSQDDLTRLAKDVIYRKLDSLLVDKYEEVLPRPLGKVYRTAVKVKVEGATLQQLTDEFVTEVHGTQVEADAKRRDLVGTSISAAALALVILVLYFFLNAGTKGYFAWPLRLISLCLLLAIYAGWFYLKGWSWI